MDDFLDFDTVSQYNAFNRNETLHPLVSVVDLSKASPRKLTRMRFGFYIVFLKEIKCGDLKYGISNYDYEEGTLVFIGPGQVVGSAGEEIYQPKGLALVFHPDFLPGTSLDKRMSDYTFFSYTTNEALHLSDRERQIIMDCFAKITYELELSIDKHSKTLIASNIELFLNYCRRFYDRQFITRETVNQGIIGKFEALLTDFFATEKSLEIGLPTVAYCAHELNLSPNYFGDLIKKETGKTALEYIHLKIMAVAKIKIANPDKQVSEIAYELGFRYPQHFSRTFKQHTGLTPLEYRNSLN